MDGYPQRDTIFEFDYFISLVRSVECFLFSLTDITTVEKLLRIFLTWMGCSNCRILSKNSGKVEIWFIQSVKILSRIFHIQHLHRSLRHQSFNVKEVFSL